MIGEMSLARSATVDLAPSEVDIICETHDGEVGGRLGGAEWLVDG